MSVFITLVSSVISAKMSINYPDFEAGNRFWNQDAVPSSGYKPLVISSAVYSTQLGRPMYDRLMQTKWSVPWAARKLLLHRN